MARTKDLTWNIVKRIYIGAINNYIVKDIHYTPTHFINSLNQMTCDESPPTQSFLNFDSLLFIKLIRGYKLIIVCKINFWIICLAPTWNLLCRKNCNKILSSKTWWEPKTVMFRELQAAHTLSTVYGPLCLINEASNEKIMKKSGWGISYIGGGIGSWVRCGIWCLMWKNSLP